jgi:2,4-dienoyl-CoA reductase-like NADH-dependent reductase (Old Yellow Enzyme family)
LIGVGGVKEKTDAGFILAEGADIVALGRTAISDPEWPLHVMNGEPVRTKYPRTGGYSSLTVPQGLDTKMVNVPGWMDLED